jgi:lipopolysaccharide heptosyltransferase II
MPAPGAATVDRQRRIDRIVGRPLCWVLTLWHRLKGADRAPDRIRRILVVLLSEMGALVLTRPMFDRLRERYPGVELFVLCSGQNGAALELLEVVPPERVILARNGSVSEFLRDSVRAIRRIRAARFDVVIDLELFARASAVYSGLSGAPIRVGFHRHTQEGLYRGDFINRAVPYSPYQHIAEQFVSLAEAIESTSVPTVKRAIAAEPPSVPPMTLRPGELERARRALRDRFPALAGGPLVFLCPGAGLLPIRAWPVAHYASLARDLAARGCAIAIVGLPEDRPLARAIQESGAAGATCADLTGYTASARDLAVLLHLGALLVTNDGGTGHFAALTPIPAIILYGPETPILYGSLSPNAVNLYRRLSCSPCLTAYNHRRSPCDGDNVCLKSITPAEVLAAACGILGLSTLA